MTKFEEEFKALTSWDWVNVDLIQKILTKFGNWHSDEEFQEILDKYSNLNDNYEKEVIRRSNLETSNLKLFAEGNGLLSDNVTLTKEVADLKSQLQQQALPVVPEDVAKLPPFDDMKEYVLDERLLKIREYLNKLDDKSNSDITEAEAWCLIHEDIAYRAMLDGYTVEKPQLFYIEFPKVSKRDSYPWVDEIDNGIIVDFTDKKSTALKLTEQEIKSIDERYWQFAVPAEDGE